MNTPKSPPTLTVVEAEQPAGAGCAPTPGSLPPKPLPCRLGELLKEWKEQEKIFDSKQNDEASCTIYACAERLKEVVGEYFDEVRAFQAARSAENDPVLP
jgi:hypothetical protein